MPAISRKLAKYDPLYSRTKESGFQNRSTATARKETPAISSSVRNTGPAANAAKYLAAEAGYHACEQAVMTHGGFGYAKEFHVERYFRESLIPRIAPISPQLILSFIAEKVLGLPKSY